MTQKSSYGQILKSSSIMGGVASINLILGMLRIKFAAILIGVTGVGLLSSFAAIQGVVGTVVGLGIQSSAVRDIAAAVAKKNDEQIGRIVISLRRICWLTGFLGMLSMLLMGPAISQWTFGSEKYKWDIGALGIVILLANVQGGQMALIQGKRRIGDLAKVQLYGAIFGTLVTVVFYLWIGVRGIVPSLVVISCLQLLISWQVAKKITVPHIKMGWMESFHQSSGMVRLGFAMMWNGFLGGLVTYATNVMITQQINLQAVGIYSAAFALSGIFVNFVLNAMAADYFPRLSEVANDEVAINRLVNEQTEIGLLLAAPGLMATLALAPIIINVFYAQEFLPAVNLLQWFILGCVGRLISWPLGFVILALNKGGIFIITETVGQLLNLIIIFIGLKFFGIEGAAIAFFASYIFYGVIVFIVAKNLTRFFWTKSSIYLLVIISVILITIFGANKLLPFVPAMIIGIILTFCGLIISLRGLLKRIDNSHYIVTAILRIPTFKFLNILNIKENSNKK